MEQVVNRPNCRVLLQKQTPWPENCPPKGNALPAARTLGDDTFSSFLE